MSDNDTTKQWEYAGVSSGDNGHHLNFTDGRRYEMIPLTENVRTAISLCAGGMMQEGVYLYTEIDGVPEVNRRFWISVKQAKHLHNDVLPVLDTGTAERERELLDRVAEVLVKKVIDEYGRGQAGWVIYILESLDNELTAVQIARVLEGIRDAIDVRLDTGAW